MIHWDTIRAAYNKAMPSIMARHRVNPYFLDWTPYMTPIEFSAWQDIRRMGIPLYPQVPVLGYFVDFGSPRAKVALELDGAAYHDEQRDLVRDTRLWRHGWRTFRVPGSEAMRVIRLDDELREARTPVEIANAICRWGDTVEGVVWAIGRTYLQARNTIAPLPAERLDALAEFILDGHRLLEFPLAGSES